MPYKKTMDKDKRLDAGCGIINVKLNPFKAILNDIIFKTHIISN